MSKVGGNIKGLKASQKKSLERLATKRVDADQIITVVLAKQMSQISRDIGRQVGVLIDRRGRVVETFVGSAKRIYLPDIGRYRGGGGQLRGLRHIHTVLNDDGLLPEDFSDLTKLRLDLIATIETDREGLPGALDYAHLIFGQEGQEGQEGPQGKESGGGYLHEQALSVYRLDVDFEALITALEQELSSRHAQRHKSTGGNGAIAVGIYESKHEASWRLAELRELATTAGVSIVEEIKQFRRRADAKYLVGKGKLEEVVLQCLDRGVELVIFDAELSPAQARAIAASSELKVIDRTQLILDIFAQRAQSRDGKLQVELAQLRYNLPRLTDLDAGLSRLTGGIGGRGPGETVLEINRRRARDKITRLSKQIDQLSEQRTLRRQKRQRSGLPVVSIVGYTNAGKSTLLNKLTCSNVGAEDKLFATLDPATRRLRFPREQEAIITDTVGFIRELPPDLVKAFRATLEELEVADLMLHVVDIADPMRDEKIAAVDGIFKEMQLASIPQLMVFNKADLLDDPWEGQAIARRYGAHAITISAEQGDGLPDLVRAIACRLWQTEALPEDDLWAADSRQQSNPSVVVTSEQT